MKTTRPARITSIPEAEAFLTALHNNGEAFHPEDNAHDVGNTAPGTSQFIPLFTRPEADHINQLMEDIYNLEGNNGNHRSPIFDPCKFLNDIEEAEIIPHIQAGAEYLHVLSSNLVTILERKRRRIVYSFDNEIVKRSITEFTNLVRLGHYQLLSK